jgi:hypothetical protein
VAQARRSGSQAAAAPRVSLARTIALAAVFAAALAVNLLTAAPTVLEGDGAELQATALLGGVPHPSGYPSFVMLGHAFGALLPGDPAFRITAMCAACGAATLVAFMLLSLELGASLGAAVAGAIVYGASFTLRWASIRAEVYALAFLLEALALWRTAVALRTGRTADAVIAAFLTGLMITGHLSSAPAALAMGAFLVFAPPVSVRARSVRESAGRAPWLLLGFLAGLTPYLYLVWADHVPHAMNYLNAIVETDAGQFGLTRATFDQPGERIPWLIVGREAVRWVFLGHPRILWSHLLDACGVEWLFELGPLALLPAAIGALHLARTRPGMTRLATAIVALSVAFTASFMFGSLVPVFLSVVTLLLAAVATLGGGILYARLWPRGPVAVRRLLAGAALAALVLAPQALRLHAYRHPIPPQRWQVEEESPPRIATLWPSLSGYRSPRRYGEAALRAIPEGSLVLGRWNEIMVLVYLQQVEKMRPDLTLDPFYHPWHLLRVARWEAKHDVARTPIVFLYRRPELEPHLDRPDSVRVDDAHGIWIQRTPLRNVEAWKNAPSGY